MSTQLEGRKLYYIENVFFLITETQELEIKEPIGWDKVLVQVKWDESTNGYRFEFSDKDALLEFDNAAGGYILRALWKARGTQAFAVLRFGERQNGNFTLLFEAELNFESISDTVKTIKMNVERKSFNDLLRTRFDFRTDLNSQIGMDSNILPPLPTRQLYLHPRLMSFLANYNYNQNIAVNQPLVTELPGDGSEYKTAAPPFRFLSQNIDGIQEPTAPDGQLLYTGLTLPPGVAKRRFFFTARLAFKFTMGNTSQFITAGFSIYRRANISGGANADFPPHVDPAANESYLIDSQAYGNVSGNKNFDGLITGAIDLGPDTGLFIKAWIYTPQNAQFPISNFEWVNPSSFQLDIREQTVVKPSVITAPRLHDAVNRQLEMILNTTNPLKSNFIGRVDLGYPVNGCAADHFIMNGLMVRKFEGRPFNFSVKDWYNGLNNVFCMGLSVERDNSENESIRFEEISYFFRNVLLMEFDIITKYEKNANMDVTFNSVSVVFKKFPQDAQQDSIEDWMTDFDYSTPLTKIKNEFKKTIDLIMSGYYIEYTRQESFRDRPTNTYETDNDVFMISARDGEVSVVGANIIFDDTADTITIMKIIAVVDLDKITIVNGTGGVTNGTYEVTAVEIPFSYDRVILTIKTALPSNGSGTGDVTVVDSVTLQPVVRSQAKRDEDFQQIKNVTFPASVYNLEHHIKRIVIRWASIFQAGWDFFYGDTTQGIAFVSGKNNIQVGTQLKASVTCTYGDPSKSLIYDRAFERSTSQFMRPPIFGKSVITFDAPLSWQKFNDLRKAFEGRHPEGKDYGYFRWTNEEGEVEEGYCRGMKFNPNKQICTFTMFEKFNT